MRSLTASPTTGVTDARSRVPVRTCVGCRQPAEQRALIRLTRTAAGQIAIDTGRRRQPGRGAYLCRASACWESALRRGGLARALRGAVMPEDREALLAHAVQFARPPAEPTVELARAVDGTKRGDAAIDTHAAAAPERRKVDDHDEPR